MPVIKVNRLEEPKAILCKQLAASNPRTRFTLQNTACHSEFKETLINSASKLPVSVELNMLFHQAKAKTKNSNSNTVSTRLKDNFGLLPLRSFAEKE